MNFKLLFRVAAIAFSVLILILAAAVGYVYSLYDEKALRQQASQYVWDNYHRQLDLRGNIALEFFPTLGVAIEDVAISEDLSPRYVGKEFPASPPSLEGASAKALPDSFVSIGKAFLGVDIVALLDKRIKIEKVGLENARANIIQKVDKSFNFNNLIPASAADKKAAPPELDKKSPDDKAMPFSLVVEAVNIKNLTVNFTDEATKQQYRLMNLNAAINNFEIGKAAPFKMAATMQSSKEKAEITVSAEGKATLKAQGGIEVAGLKVSAQGGASLPEVGTIALKSFNLAGALKHIEGKTTANFSTLSSETEVTPIGQGTNKMAIGLSLVDKTAIDFVLVNAKPEVNIGGLSLQVKGDYALPATPSQDGSMSPGINVRDMHLALQTAVDLKNNNLRIATQNINVKGLVTVPNQGEGPVTLEVKEPLVTMTMGQMDTLKVAVKGINMTAGLQGGIGSVQSALAIASLGLANGTVFSDGLHIKGSYANTPKTPTDALAANFELRSDVKGVLGMATKTQTTAMDKPKPAATTPPTRLAKNGKANQNKSVAKTQAPVIEASAPQKSTLAQTLLLSNLSIKGDIKTAALPKPVALSLTGAANANLTAQTATLDLAGTVHKTSLKLNAALRDFAKPEPNVSLWLDQFNLDEFFPPAPKVAASKEEKKSSGPAQDIPIDLSGLKGLKAQLKITANKIIAQGIEVDALNMALLADGQRVLLDPLSFNIASGKFLGKASLQPDQQKVTLNTVLDKVNFGDLLTTLKITDILRGKADVNLAVTTEGKSLNQFKSHLEGKISFKAMDGGIKGFNIAQQVRNLRAQLSNEDLPKEEKNKELYTDFAELSASFDANKGVLTNTDTILVAPFFRLTGAGKVNIVDETLDYRTMVKMTKSGKGQGVDLQSVGGGGIPIRISGLLQSPKIEVDTKAMKDEFIREQKEKADKLIEEKKAELQKQLDAKKAEMQKELDKKAAEAKQKADEAVKKKLDEAKQKAGDKLKDSLKGLFK